MAIHSNDKNYGQEICHIFNLDPVKVRSLKLEIYPDSAIVIHAELYVEHNDMMEFIKTTQKYEITQKDNNHGRN